ncbi:MAG: Hint domain-containing protein [Albidovulum sp.]
MSAAIRGTFVIGWGQTEVDGVLAPPTDALCVGVQWRWQGEACRIDGPAQILPLAQQPAHLALRDRAANGAQKFLKNLNLRSRMPTPRLGANALAPPFRSFAVTDGCQRFDIGIVERPLRERLLYFSGTLPPRDRDLHVIGPVLTARTPEIRKLDRNFGGLARGARISTPQGPRMVEDIRVGDQIDSRDNGPQEVVWIGTRALGSAQLQAKPHLRPLRLRLPFSGHADLILAPGQRILHHGADAQALFATPDVLIAAADIADTQMGVSRVGDSHVTYFHLMTSAHQIIIANGVAAGSCHPAFDSPALFDPDQRAALFACFPEVATDPFRYGPPVHRNLTPAEVAILRRGGDWP